MKTMRRAALAALAVTAALALPAHATEGGEWVVKLGAHAVNPDSGNGTLAGTLDAEIGTDWRPTITGEYFVTPNLGIELLASLPFEHDVKLNGVRAATVKHLPPTLSVQYHFLRGGRVSPYLGAGVNYTWIHDEETRGPLDGADLDLDNSWGLAAHAGVDFTLSNGWIVGVDARWIDIDSDVRVDGANVGHVSIDPFVYGAYVGWTF